MAITCPVCGKGSCDQEFCDHCNADLSPPPVLSAPSACPFLPAGLELTAEQVSILSRPDAAVVVQGEDRCWRVHWLAPAVWEDHRQSLAERSSLGLATLPSCRVLQDGVGTWVAAETNGVPAQPWLTPAETDPIAELHRLLRFLQPLAEALSELHGHGLVWLTFDPRALEEVPPLEEEEPDPPQPPKAGPRLRVTNLDLGVFPAGRCPERLPLKPAFAAPEVCRFQAADLGPHTDVFHLALFSYYWLAGRLPHGFSGAGLEAFHFRLPLLRIFAPNLPPGISPVLLRGLAVDPRQRQATPAEFCHQLQQAVERAEERWRAAGPLRWEIGSDTRVGRARESCGRGNEDYVVVREFAAPPRALLGLADGISTCDVGNGALASRLTCIVLENTFDEHSDAAAFAKQIADAFCRGSQALLDWALERGYQRQLVHGRDLMGTTLIAGWLQDRRLYLAAVGDSRVYLINDQGIDQLTVDGDLGSVLLATGVAPEEVQEMGGAARALRTCIGGCVIPLAGKLQVVPDVCQPTLFSLPLQPGDVVVLCSDGLVEEEVFLDPETLENLVRTRKDLSAAKLASRLAEQADDLQRLPSPLEPYGFGDNISCMVIKVEGVRG